MHRDVDKPSYRYGHPLLGWIAWVLSAGQSGAAAAALLVAGLLSIAAAAALAASLGGTWAALFVACNPGLLYAASHSLAEPLAVALLLGVIAAARSDRWRLAVGACVLLPLAKEPLLLVPAAYAAWALWRGPRRLAIPFAASVVPSVAWWIAMRIHLGAWFTSGGTALGTPFAGWRRAILDAGVRAAAGELGEATVVVIAAVGGLLVCTTIAALRLRGPVDLVFVLLAILTACLATNATVILRDALRNIAPLVALVPFVVAMPRGSAAASGERGRRPLP